MQGIFQRCRAFFGGAALVAFLLSAGQVAAADGWRRLSPESQFDSARTYVFGDVLAGELAARRTALGVVAKPKWAEAAKKVSPARVEAMRALPALRTWLDAVGEGALDVTAKTGEWNDWVNSAFDVIDTKFPLNDGADLVVSVLDAGGSDAGCSPGAASNTVADCPARAFVIKNGKILKAIDFTACFAAYNPAENITAQTLARVDVKSRTIEIETHENGKTSCPAKRVDASRLFDSLK